MPAYIICTMTIHDPETYRKYTALTPATLTRYGGKFLSRGEPIQSLEGPAFTERQVILEFPDTAAAQAWYHDADYQSASAFRRMASTGQMYLQAGSNDSAAPDPKV